MNNKRKYSQTIHQKYNLAFERGIIGKDKIKIILYL